MFGRSTRDPLIDGSPAPRERTRGQLDPERRVAAWVGASIVFQGRLTSSEDLTIAGRVKGDVEVRENLLVVAPDAHIEGNIHARDVIVNGRVTGDIEAKGTVEIGATGTVAGDIVTPRMAVTEGATLNGRLRIAASDRTAAG